MQLKDEELQSKKREQHLDFLVGQTEKFSKMIAADMQGVTPTLSSGGSHAVTSSTHAAAASHAGGTEDRSSYFAAPCFRCVYLGRP